MRSLLSICGDIQKASELEQYRNIEFKTLDVTDDDTSILIEKYSIRNVPTTLILDENDELVYKLIGNIPLDEFTSVIDNAINKE
jgi:thioredoxin-related protein